MGKVTGSELGEEVEKELGSELGEEVEKVQEGLGEVSKVQFSPTSSKWPQLLTPSPAWLQLVRLVSKPRQPTSSKMINWSLLP